jgi:hypothetical protein
VFGFWSEYVFDWDDELLEESVHVVIGLTTAGLGGGGGGGGDQ